MVNFNFGNCLEFFGIIFGIIDIICFIGDVLCWVYLIFMLMFVKEVKMFWVFNLLGLIKIRSICK